LEGNFELWRQDISKTFCHKVVQLSEIRCGKFRFNSLNGFKMAVKTNEQVRNVLVQCFLQHTITFLCIFLCMLIKKL
jgi:hypothetical protein